MQRPAVLCSLLAIAALFPLAARAEHTHFWRESAAAAFQKGTPKGVAIRSDGKLLPAPQLLPFAEPNLSYVWALRADSQGRIYAAGGSNAKVLRFDSQGKATTVFESSELSAQAIALDAAGNLYVGTSPDGKIYKVTPQGQKSVFFEPKTKYIWALEFDSGGNLFAGTGDKAQVFVVGPDGKGEVFYHCDERHARALSFDSKGNLLLGTSPSGLIIRVGVQREKGGLPKAGPAFVVYETDKSEVTALLQDALGNVYAASVGQKSGAPLPFPAALLSALTAPQQQIMISSSQGAALTPSVSPQAAPMIPAPAGPAMTGGAEVVKIAPDGSPERIWESRQEIVFAAALPERGEESAHGEAAAANHLILGTGNQGAVIEAEGRDLYATIAKTEAAQVTALLPTPSRKIYLATANPGKIFALGPGPAPGGSFESDAFDAGIFSRWGRLDWWGENGAASGAVEFYVRSGNTSNPRMDWSAWSGPYTKPGAEPVTCPAARFAQWKAVFRATDSSGMPSVSWVSLAYQPHNVAPVIEDIAIQDPGVRIQEFPFPQAAGANIPVPLHMPRGQEDGASGPNPGAIVAAAAAAARMQAPPQGLRAKGYESVLWSARDDNGDDLVFSVYYRGEGEKNWRLLKDKLAHPFYSWDATTMPDGAYYLKIVASDAPSNPPDQARSAGRESGRFEIVNTPPAVSNVRAEDVSAGKARISFEARSAASTIARARYSLDAGDWKIVFPKGVLSDGPAESYEFQLSGLAPGEHTISVRVRDRFQNTAAAKLTFTIPEASR